MNARNASRALLLSGVSLGIALVLSMGSAFFATASAQTLVPSVLRTAAANFAPLPNSTILTPEIVQHVQRIAEKERWQLPADDVTWPLDEDGTPIVETRRRDALWHVAARGEGRASLRAKFRGVRQIEKLNPDVDLNALQPGDEILVWQRDPDAVSQSRGKANRGRLINGEPMPPGEGYQILYPYRAFGTHYTVSEVVHVLDAFHERFPETPDLLVGDLSVRVGRTLSPHKSHQSGRDVDITYPRLTEPRTYSMFTYIRRDEIDIPKSFWLIKYFIDRGHVEYMFMDRKWQYRLRKHAEELGAPEEWLNAVFQYRSNRPGRAIVRYSRGHDKHFHVRFKCQQTDRHCF